MVGIILGIRFSINCHSIYATNDFLISKIIHSRLEPFHQLQLLHDMKHHVYLFFTFFQYYLQKNNF